MAPSLKQKLLPLAIVSVLGAAFMAQCAFAGEPRYIRVAIIENAASLNIKAGGSYEISDPLGKKVLFRGRRLMTTALASGNGILIQGKNINRDEVFIKTREPDSIIINGRIFRGDVTLARNSANNLDAVNYIELEDYIKGISIREISHYWPPEAIKAAVIVFRSFALYKMQEGSSRNYDVTSDIYSQVYSGQAAERYRINKIADETKGVFLAYRTKVLPAFYHACCGGATEAAALVWNIDIAPLAGVACPFCKESPHFKWHGVLALKEIEGKLAAAGYKISGIKEITALGRDKSARITDLKIISAGKSLKISAKDFRNIIGPNIIKSVNFSVNVVWHDAVFEGFGWGHGVGMCQWGSYFMAKQGYTYQDILKYYYPGSELSRY